MTRDWWHGDHPLWTGVVALIGVTIGVALTFALDLSDALGGLISIACVVVLQLVVWRTREGKRSTQSRPVAGDHKTEDQ